MSINTEHISPIKFGNINVNLEFYNGPLDLLLHLVKKKEVPIGEVKLADIIDDYLEIISNAQSLNSIDLDDAGEYLVIASNLLSFKSKSLLPSSIDAELDIELQDQDSSGLEELRKRLIEYAKVKEDAKRLMLMPQLGIDQFKRGVNSDFSDIDGVDKDLAEGQDSIDLGRKYYQLLNRIGKGDYRFKISLEPLTTSYVVRNVMDFFKRRKTNKTTLSSLISELIRETKKKLKSKSGSSNYDYAVKNAIISTFCAILELANKKTIQVEKEGDDLRIISKIAMDYEEDSEKESSIEIPDKKAVNE